MLRAVLLSGFSHHHAEARLPHVKDIAAAAAHRKEPTAFKLKEAVRLATSRMTKTGAAMETELMRTKVQLLAELKLVTSTAGSSRF